MHSFSDLVSYATNLIMGDISLRNARICDELQTTGTTSLVIGLQTLQMQRAILVTGMFSMFEAELQTMLSCQYGFEECKRILGEKGETKLKSEFQFFIWAVNTLKHGKGNSYDNLVKNIEELPFVIKSPGENFFFEGDVGEIQTLVEVDDRFVYGCAELIRKIMAVIE